MKYFHCDISQITPINPQFSSCKVRVLHTGKNQNLSLISKEAITRALPTLRNIPIVGEFLEENDDFGGHGGTIDLDTYKYIHTTKPYGVVPESATFEWEHVKGEDGYTREYLTIHGCYLWTGRYEETNHILEQMKGQSMEIEVTNSTWNSSEETYEIHDFIFSALCILGDRVSPAFPEAVITSSRPFKQEFSLMMKELHFSLSPNEEVNTTMTTTTSDLQEETILHNETEPQSSEQTIEKTEQVPEQENQEETSEEVFSPSEKLEEEFQELKARYQSLLQEANELRSFKHEVEKNELEDKATRLFEKLQLDDGDLKEIDIHSLTFEQIEEKCYSILGRKMANSHFTKKDSKSSRPTHLPLFNEENQDQPNSPYGNLFEKYWRN
ncbi:hypothetical protein [Thermoactinomyces sp. DSM 45892]|uniref:hypothetical protein n=1 Tax=Thermoactinomyces sp. DSM 45892 TaxID=1882753 RepID=UPI0008990990|nr:hypothetical protein [Thermoactinomyces sp. DSM 45892]SDX95327.1 hypothetical protein SAMN05444416_10191 [Thermoactinomyces sp. DSM 45892]